MRRSFDTVDEAQHFLDELSAQSELNRIRSRDPAQRTVGEVVEEWWRGPPVDGERRGGHRQRIAARTARDYQLYIDKYISQVANQRARDYDENPALLKLFYDTLPNRMAWHVHGVLRLAFKEAAARGHLVRNPCLFEKPARRKRTRRIIPTREEVEKIIAAAEEIGAGWGLFAYLTATLGTRCGETVALRAEDFDLEAGIVHVERAVSKTEGRPTLKEPKKGEPRDLPMDDPDFWDYVRPFLDGPGFCFRGFYRDEQRKEPEAREKPWHPDHAADKFKKMIRAIGLPPYTLHSLRHFVATQLLIEGQPINQVAEFLGHTPQMTLMLYGRHLDREAMRRVGRAAAGITRREARVVSAERSEPKPPATDTPKPRAPQGWRWALDAIVEMAGRGAITNAGVRAETGLTRRQASKALDELVRAGRVSRQGTQRGTTYMPPLR
jgi:integrase